MHGTQLAPFTEDQQSLTRKSRDEVRGLIIVAVECSLRLAAIASKAAPSGRLKGRFFQPLFRNVERRQ